ncbi:MAG TPA: Wzz/FepE/Etk N-terminal domain-containing protein, partial [Bacteroidota bacterium]|nr:Wzz/FepE/Etk N-terminal domain-containing protein [Bacteroidota bacterium]
MPRKAKHNANDPVAVAPTVEEEFLHDEEAESSIDWEELLSVVWSSRKLIGMVTGGVTVASVIISLLLPNYFRSTATLLPETE